MIKELKVIKDTPKVIRISNSDGIWEIAKELVGLGNGALTGPGYISRFIPWGKPLMVDEMKYPSRTVDGRPTIAINDARFGGLGAFGAHVRREGDEAHDLTVRRSLDTGMGGVLSSSAEIFDISPKSVHVFSRVALADIASNGESVLELSYLWEFKPNCVNCILTVLESWTGKGPKLYIKEPKVCFAMLHKPEEAKIYAKSGKLIRSFDLTTIHDPRKHTQQIRGDRRCRVQLDDFNIVGEAWDGHKPVKWKPSKYGFDGWALWGNQQKPFEELTEKQLYCRQGKDHTLSRNWEISRWSQFDDVTHMAFHAWEGGYGHPDCWCAGVPVKPGGSHSIYFSMSMGNGWEV